jgi:hypothetical protein
LLDNFSTSCKYDLQKNLAVNSREVDEKLELETNAGEFKTNLKAMVPGFSEL